MSFLWTAVSATLGAELLVLALLCAPLPWGVRKNIARLMHTFRHSRFHVMLKYVMFGLILALVESLNSLKNVLDRKGADAKSGGISKSSGEGMIEKQDFGWRKARAERNLYMAAFAITCIIAIIRLVSLVANEISLKDRIKALNGGKPITESGEDVDDKKRK